jgi:hypothetical protein
MLTPLYYHRQADLCVRLALTASKNESERLLLAANEYRAHATIRRLELLSRNARAMPNSKETLS